MSKKAKDTKRVKVWYCVDCKIYVDPRSRVHHQAHRGRYGFPTLKWQSKRSVVVNGPNYTWVLNSELNQRLAATKPGDMVVTEAQVNLEIAELGY